MTLPGPTVSPTLSTDVSVLPSARAVTRRIPELSVVMPVYNEEAVVGRVVRAWTWELDRLGIDYEFLVYDDGSRDRTREVLGRLAQEFPRLVFTSRPNAGHGPTILAGYHRARGTWIFQVDSDDELGSEDFGRLWERRHDYDLLLGSRAARQSPLARRVLSATARLTVWTLFGRAVADVNAPYRLVRRTCLEKMIRRIPSDTFAPNVILSGLASRDRLRVLEVGVTHRNRVTGTASLVRWRLVRAAIRSFRQAVTIGLRERLSR